MADLNISYEWEGLDGVKDAVQKVADAVEPPNLTASLGDGAEVFLLAIVDQAPVDTGALVESVRKWPESPTAWATGPDTDEIPYAFIQEYGGTIFPKPGNTLGKDGQGLLVWNDGGHWFSAKSVTIPALRYMETAFVAGEAEAAAAVAESVRRDINS